MEMQGRDLEIFRQCASGRTRADVARQFNLSQTRVHEIIGRQERRLAYEARRKREILAVGILHRQGWTPEEIAEVLGDHVDIDRVHEWLVESQGAV